MTKQALEEFEKRFSPFFIVNNDHKVLNYQIDLHGGLQKTEAAAIFSENYSRILKGLRDGSINPNTVDGDHVIKVICGYGNHTMPSEDAELREKIETGGLKSYFLNLFKTSRPPLDCAYIKKDGCFLIRVRKYA